MNCAICRGACCENTVLVIGARFEVKDPDTRRWIRLHNIEIVDGALKIETRCTALTSEGRCEIYDERPLICSVFPRGGKQCLTVVRERRTPEDYQRIREVDDPEVIHV